MLLTTIWFGFKVELDPLRDNAIAVAKGELGLLELVDLVLWIGKNLVLTLTAFLPRHLFCHQK